MARGKKTSPEKIYEVMASWAVTQNYSQTAKNLNMAESTVEKIVKDNKNKEEFVKLCADKKAIFIDKADKVIDLTLKRMTDMLTNEEERIPLNQLAVVFGTAYDKRALAKGDSTNNIVLASNMDINKLAEISGYTKKDADIK